MNARAHLPKTIRRVASVFGILACLILLIQNAHAVRIKDIADIKGVRHNQLVGYGLVVGLEGTGDSDDSLFTIQSLASLLEKMGVTVQPGDIEDVVNVAAVMVTADLPPFASLGSRIDVLVSSIGDAENLQGGTLLFTPLKAADGSVYAVAQGAVSTGGFAVSGNSGDQVQKNFPTVGRVVGGALVEKEIDSNFNQKASLTLALHASDFTTASRVAQAINRAFYNQLATTENATSIQVRVPEDYLGKTVQFALEHEYSGSRDLRIAILEGFKHEPYHEIVGPTKKRGGPAAPAMMFMPLTSTTISGKNSGLARRISRSIISKQIQAVNVFPAVMWKGDMTGRKK